MIPLISKQESKGAGRSFLSGIQLNSMPSKISDLPFLNKLSQDGTWIKSYDKNLNAFLQTSTQFHDKYNKYDFERFIDTQIKEYSFELSYRDNIKAKPQPNFLVYSGTKTDEGLIYTDKQANTKNESEPVFDYLLDDEKFLELDNQFIDNDKINIQNINDCVEIERLQIKENNNQILQLKNLMTLHNDKISHIILAWSDSDKCISILYALFNLNDQFQKINIE